MVILVDQNFHGNNPKNLNFDDKSIQLFKRNTYELENIFYSIIFFCDKFVLIYPC